MNGSCRDIKSFNGQFTGKTSDQRQTDTSSSFLKDAVFDQDGLNQNKKDELK